MHAELRLDHQVRVGRKRVERLMRRHGLSGLVKRRRGRTTVRVPGVRPAPDLVRATFARRALNALSVADLTEVRTWESKLYLAVVLDCYSRRVIGWGHGRAHASRARPRGARDGRPPPQASAGLVHHSDQGSQYVSLVFGKRCREAGVDVSMGARGSALDNAVRVVLRLAQEGARAPALVPTRAEARSAGFECIEGWYNRRRLHSTLGYLSPAHYKEQIPLNQKMTEKEAA